MSECKFQNVTRDRFIHTIGNKDVTLEWKFDTEDVILVWGKMITRFGQTKYVAYDMEDDAFCYYIEVEREDNILFCMEVFYSHGLMIRCGDSTLSEGELRDIMKYFIVFVENAEPSDFSYTGLVSDYALQEEWGIQKGKVYLKEKELDEVGRYVEVSQEEIPIIQLRSLTIAEKKKCKCLVGNVNTELYQYFLGIVASDLIPEGEISIEKLRELTKVMDVETDSIYLVESLLQMWFLQCAEYRQHGLMKHLDIEKVRGLKTNMDACVYGFISCVYDIGIGTIGKKQNDLEREFRNLEKWLWEKKGKDIYQQPEIVYRFALTYAEQLGFRFVSTPVADRKIDLAIFKECAL